MISEEKFIRVLTEEVREVSNAILPSAGRQIISKSFEITNEVLAENVEEFFKSFQKVIDHLPNSISGFSVDEIQLTLTVNANGGVELVGKAEAGVTTGLTFTLKRSSKEILEHEDAKGTA